MCVVDTNAQVVLVVHGVDEKISRDFKMTNITVAICGVLYLLTAIGFVVDKNWGFALTYFAYALANVGLILAAGGFK